MGRIVKDAEGDNNRGFANIVNAGSIPLIYGHSGYRIGRFQNEAAQKSLGRRRHI